MAGKISDLPQLTSPQLTDTCDWEIRDTSTGGTGTNKRIQMGDVRTSITGGLTAASIGAQPLDSDLTAIAALATTPFGRSLLALADAASGRTALGLGTAATQPSTAFDAAGAASAAQAASQPTDPTLTALAAYNTNGLVIQTAPDTFAGRTLTPGSTRIAVANGTGVAGNPTIDIGTLAESDITNLPADLSSLQTTGALNAAKHSARDLAEAGQYVCTGGALTPSGTAGRLDLAAGTDFMVNTEFVYAAQTAIATTITSMADPTNPKWVIVELDQSGVVQFNQGAAAPTPVFPTFTSTRTPHGYLYIPANATLVDALLTTNNGRAKLIDARVLRSLPRGRLFAYDAALTSLTNPVALTSLLATTPPVPANSSTNGDTYHISASGLYKNTQNASTFQLELLIGIRLIWNYTSASLSLDATNSRRWELDVWMTLYNVGATTNAVTRGEFSISAASAATNAIQKTSGGAANGDQAMLGAAISAQFDATAIQTFDLQALIGTTSSTATVSLRHFAIEKFPAV